MIVMRDVALLAVVAMIGLAMLGALGWMIYALIAAMFGA